MAQKVYRLHDGAQNSGWFDSAPITTSELDSIITIGKEAATSIPSPFAQIDLVKTAFAQLAQTNVDIHYDADSEFNKAHHKLVAESLDVAQLFFESQKFSKSLKIIAYDPKERMAAFQKSGDNSKHAALADTLDVFWTLDAKAFNFDQVKRLYFILTNSNELIGSTSPTTLFLAAPEAEKIMQHLPPFTCGVNTLFDGKLNSLDQRDPDFILYLFTLAMQPNFASNFRELNAYMLKAKRLLSRELLEKIALIQPEDIQKYDACNVLGTPGNICEVLGINLGTNKISKPINSDFTIKSDFSLNEQLPLVLPNYTFTEDWIYTTDSVKWDRTKKAPDKNYLEADESMLPHQAIPFYWLSADNFLEEKIIKLPYFIDKSKFITSGLNEYLLPLTPTFFHYFSVDKVHKFLKLDVLAAGGIEAKLTIPTKKGNLVFKKIYNSSDIVKLDAHFAILPFVKSEEFKIDYTLGIQDARIDKTAQLSLESFNEGKKVGLSSPTVRRPDVRGSLIKSSYYKSQPFDCIRVIKGAVSGFILPVMKQSSTNNDVSFAIDFGTTNTHIEYKYSNSSEKALDVRASEPMWQSLIELSAQNRPEQLKTNSEFARELIPYEFHEESPYKFPFRTAIAYNHNVDFFLPFSPFIDFNNYFLLEKEFYSQSMKVETGIKWGNYKSDKDKKLVESYIDYLLSIVLYKTLMLNGNPKETKITWFYPVSMGNFELGVFSSAWEESYKKKFQSTNLSNINKIPESIAPYLYYRTQNVGSGLSIDIGGGSSDIAIFENGEKLPRFISSIKFAGNAIFGDRFENTEWSNNSDTNGFVKMYKDKVEKAIESMTTSNKSNIEEIYKNIVNNRKNSADFSSFLFSLENEKTLDFNYSKLLQGDKYLKLPILVFYTSIMYYSAVLCKKQKLELPPKNIFFSGTASKTLRILDASPNFSTISKLFKFILEKVLETKIDRLDVKLDTQPKEITCKGVLKAGIDSDVEECPVVFWLGSKEDSRWGQSLSRQKDFSKFPTYKDLTTEEKKENIINSIQESFQIVDEFFETIGNIENIFGIGNDAYKTFQEIRSSNLKDYLDAGIRSFYKSDEDKIEESLFFYPLTGLLNELTTELVNLQQQ